MCSTAPRSSAIRRAASRSRRRRCGLSRRIHARCRVVVDLPLAPVRPSRRPRRTPCTSRPSRRSSRSKFQRGASQSCSRALSVARRSRLDSCGPPAPVLAPLAAPNRAITCSTTSRTDRVSVGSGPKFQLSHARRDRDAVADSRRAPSVEVTAERLEHVLPGTRRVRMCARRSVRPARQRANRVGHDAIGRPVAAADDVAGARGRDREPCSSIVSGGKKLRR